MKPVQVRIISVLKACRNSLLTKTPPTTTTALLLGPPRLKPLNPPPPPPPPPPQHPQLTQRPLPYFLPSSYGNYCLDLFFHAPQAVKDILFSREYFHQLLRQAWFHNPLTTLKLICHLLDSRCCGGKNDRENFYRAAYWLHHNHPKTLASNVASIASSFGSFDDVIEILYRLLHGEDVRNRSNNQCQSELINGAVKRRGNSKVLSCRRLVSREIRVMKAVERSKLQKEKARALRRDKIAEVANTAVERYKNDADYRFLHDRISDVFAECLKSDTENLNKEKDVNFNRHRDCLELSLAAEYCPKNGSFMDSATLLCETIAKKVFPREMYPEYEGLEEVHYAYRVRDRLRKEVLVPLRKALDIADYHSAVNQWGYNPDFKREPCLVKKYLEDVKAAGIGIGNSKIAANALLPHEIVLYVKDSDVGETAEVQWKAMVEGMRRNKSMNVLKESLVVCDVSEAMNGLARDVSAGLAIMMSELSDDPWKGKVITFSESPQLHSIQGGNLKSKCDFLKNMEWGYYTKFEKVFDLILEAAVNANLKAEQMVKKVFVLTRHIEFDDASDNSWERDCKAIKSKFEKKGYGDVVPEIFFWNLWQGEYSGVRYKEQEGVAIFCGLDNPLVKSFLENDGSIGPDHFMEAAISSQEYQSLVVVD